MATLCLKKLLDQARWKEANYLIRYFASSLVQPPKRTTLPPTWISREHAIKGLLLVPTQAFATDEGAEEEPTRKKKNPNAKKTVESIGRKIPYRIIQLIDDNGNNAGTMHRSDVLRILDESGLKLVLQNEKADPPVYRLMSGQQIHEERLKLREKQKASSKSGPVQQKEMKFSTMIAQHDLDTKIKQIQQWIDKKHHIRITLRQRNVADGPEKMMALFDQILDTMPEKATYLSQPRIVKEGSSTCVLRHMSEKEIREYKAKEKNKDLPKDNGKDAIDADALQH
ncbi:translation initiation factor IF-3, mitochondrial [Elgaria multicarinata webbii]|uniref:translation initiation factor IF-3, mitochondrial n=1 Tax=Elgaria multicarinata webbii TaxID=159646 RepID=UPI002FCCF8B6